MRIDHSIMYLLSGRNIPSGINKSSWTGEQADREKSVADKYQGGFCRAI